MTAKPLKICSELESSHSELNGSTGAGGLGKGEVKVSSPRKLWERILRKVIKIIRHLTSLQYPEPDDQIIRKIITELQHWFVVPYYGFSCALRSRHATW